MVTTRRGGIKVLYQGFSYHYHSKSQQKSHWRCVERTSCRSWLTLDDDQNVLKHTAHSDSCKHTVNNRKKIVKYENSNMNTLW